MKITICEDSIEDLMYMEKLLLKYKEANPHLEFVTEKYTDSNKLYKKIPEAELSDLYILDMLMPKKTGIDIGRQIRKKGKESVILYTTSSDEYALEAYGIHALRYLLKPLKETEFFEAVDAALSSFSARKDPLYPVKTKEGVMAVPYSRIEYVENVSRILHVHMTDKRIIKSLFIRKSFDEEVKPLVDERNFMQVHKSFVVNLQHVEKLTQESMIMENGGYVPVSKNKSADVKRRYLLFVVEGCR